MELPLALRAAVDAVLHDIPLSEISKASAVLSARYRAELRDGRMHLSDDLFALAYLATRLPATYAAIHAALSATTERLPGFAPLSQLDAGAGPGSAVWAARDIWPDLTKATLLEGSPAIRAQGAALMNHAGMAGVDWLHADLLAPLPDLRADLVTLTYVLDELAPEKRAVLVRDLWARTTGLLLVVEPGTPAGWQRILSARDVLIAEGAHIAAPCPHVLACGIAPPDWCHFSRRVARSRLHRQAKNADLPWEDEKFIYIAAARAPAIPAQSRVLAPPRTASGQIRLKLCAPDASVAEHLITKRDGPTFKTARRLDWGDEGPGL